MRQWMDCCAFSTTNYKTALMRVGGPLKLLLCLFFYGKNKLKVIFSYKAWKCNSNFSDLGIKITIISGIGSANSKQL